ncbi:hypothetical protein [Lactococcus kimchii]|uniref:hypothetical protein n=1 Tax=Lactococcus sp. S-13 TaxID=2507158 RepID=UPI001023DD17|nr:hypothetical protein [Lactococcus sp. S-13]RZI49354.1 hypothetical protein EQJ87_07820 [Lactococcus sp. S-13]
MKKLNMNYLCLVIGISSMILSFFDGIRALSLPLGIIGVLLAIIFITKNKQGGKTLLILALIISFLSVPLAYSMTALSHHTDYPSVETFQKALDDNENLTGKTVRFKVTDVSAASGFYSVRAGDDIAFYISKTDIKGIQKGDTVTIKVKSKAADVLGIYLMNGKVE